MLDNFFDRSSESQRVDVAIGDQRQQRQVRGDTSTIRDSRYCLERLCRKLETLLLNCLRPQPPGTELARDQGTHSLARCAPLWRDAGVQPSDFLDGPRIAPDLSGAYGNLRSEGFGFVNRGAGLHDGAIGNCSRDPLSEGAIACDIDWNSRPRWHETQAALMKLDDLAVKVDAFAP
jgi:hypothetical protein